MLVEVSLPRMFGIPQCTVCWSPHCNQWNTPHCYYSLYSLGFCSRTEQVSVSKCWRVGNWPVKTFCLAPKDILMSLEQLNGLHFYRTSAVPKSTCTIKKHMSRMYFVPVGCIIHKRKSYPHNSNSIVKNYPTQKLKKGLTFRITQVFP